MPPTFLTIEDYEDYLTILLNAWTPRQRLAFAISLAERWYPAYLAFSEAENWGDPAALRKAIDAVWAHLRGRSLSSASAARHASILRDLTPHMDDFDALEALVACSLAGDALRGCTDPDTPRLALGAALSCFEPILEPLDPDSQPRSWKKPAVRRELAAQMKLIEAITAGAGPDDLRHQASSRALLVRTPQKKKPSGPAPISNQAAFESYRLRAELAINSARSDPAAHANAPTVYTLLIFAEWAGRYSRRRDTLTGLYGPLADRPGLDALLARNRVINTAGPNPPMPAWDKDVFDLLALSYANLGTLGQIDSTTLIQPHAYGPSLLTLWNAAIDRGRTPAQAWLDILAWARHRPPAWEREDQRKRRGQGHASPELADALARLLAWSATTDPLHPWSADVDGALWRIRLNDFPDDLLYTLLIDDRPLGDFHDWPDAWER